jgi:hypothetical protein
MTTRVRTYRLVTPPPWARISLREDTRRRIEEIVDDVAARHTPAQVPPDHIGPKKRELVESLMTQVREAQEHGGVDLYIPLADIHGYSVQAAFVVSEVTPNALMTNDEVPDVLASLLADPGTSPVTVDESVWVRRETTVAPTKAMPAPSRRVEYVTSVPGTPRYWIMAAFTSAGPPVTDPEDPDGVDLLIGLFDAIMTTWRWVYEPAPSALVGSGEDSDGVTHG